MSSTATPMGLMPYAYLDGSPYTGTTRAFSIASATGNSIFQGSIVNLTSAGVIQRTTEVGTNADPFPTGVLGVFMGCRYTDPNTKQMTYSNRWPAGTVADDAFGYVAMADGLLFKIQASATLAQTDLGRNFGMVYGTGSDLTGNSRAALDASTSATTNTVGLRLVDFIRGPDSVVGDAYPDILVKFNAPFFGQTTGI